MPETRPSALKSSTPDAVPREPLLGTLVRSPPSKTQRVGEQVDMEAAFAPIPQFPGKSGNSGNTSSVCEDSQTAFAAQQARLA